MARREKFVTIEKSEGNRDSGKTFRITEMPAEQAEWWATRAVLAMSNGGVEVPENAFDLGWAGLLIVGIRGLGNMRAPEAKPLLDEMFECVAFVPPSAGAAVITGPQVSMQIEEVTTRMRLREEVMSLHAGFSIAAAISNLLTTAAEARRALLNTETSPGPSEPSSPEASPPS